MLTDDHGEDPPVCGQTKGRVAYVVQAKLKLRQCAQEIRIHSQQQVARET